MFLYNFGIYLYAFVVRLISPFHRKARKMIVGHKQTYKILKEKIDKEAKYIWFHAASLGEFEQGRPIIEAIKREYPQYKILLTFFSPSGYEVRKDYPDADIVCYLPFDKKRNVRKFLTLAKPEMAIFIKYEFWYNFVSQLNKRNIPIYMVSAIFRADQIFFRWYGSGMRELLDSYTRICVQDENSKELLNKIGKDNVVVCGDTRFDRVLEIKNKSKSIELIDLFSEQRSGERKKIFVSGSSWPKDEDIFVPYFNNNAEVKLIIAPHEISEAHLKYIEGNLKRPYIRFSKANKENVQNYDCIIIDSFGLLSSIYRYGHIAYIGGGFGVGIHNILEAAVYDIPVVFGPNFKKFREAHDLIENGGGYSIKNQEEFNGLMDEFMQYDETLNAAGRHAGSYVQSKKGAVESVLAQIQL